MLWTLLASLQTLSLLALLGATGWGNPEAYRPPAAVTVGPIARPSGPISPAQRLVEAAVARTRQRVRYDGRYRQIDYPGGDVPSNIGVCTDLVVRSYRALGLDLQKAVHEDMTSAFSDYPRIWGLRRPDPNIDHRRVPNLRVFLRRQGAALPVGRDPARYQPGDLVTWIVGDKLPHIGIVTDRRSTDGERPLIVHNIGAGPRVEDMLLSYPITGHYRYAAPE